jgi:hypothetical protein
MHRTVCKPADKPEGCVHHWLIDSKDVGQCLKCGVVRDFRRAAGKTWQRAWEVACCDGDGGRARLHSSEARRNGSIY